MKQPQELIRVLLDSILDKLHLRSSAAQPQGLQPQGLIEVLLDSKAEYGDRDDAAMDLEPYDEPEVELALATVALDPTTDPDLAERCGESIALIWCRKGNVNVEVLKRLKGPALEIALAIIGEKPEWESIVKQIRKPEAN